MQETESLGQSKHSQTAVYRFLSRLVFGLIGAILIGIALDNNFGTNPWIMLVLLLYVIFGSLVLLVKELA